MKLSLSRFGERFCAESGTFTLMDDLGKALTINPDMLFLGGGNPARIAAVEAEIGDAFQALLAEENGVQRLCSNYQSPQGDPQFLQAVAGYLQRQCGWPITPDNIALANGSQAAFFVLFNMFAGEFATGEPRQILLPMAPEYIGYASAGLSDDFFISKRPHISLVGEQQFKYSIDFETLPMAGDKLDARIGAICLSRPTNPTGNVITDEELERLSNLAQKSDIPLIIDAAYGLPFPGIVFDPASSPWNEQVIYLLSLSKLGLPGVRTGIIVAHESVIAAYTRANTALNLACSSPGPVVTRPWFEQDRVNYIAEQLVQPYYRTACQQALAIVLEACKDLPVRVHVPQGAIFLWLWCEDLPITSQELYQRLKQRGVLVLSGHHFFVGLEDDWPHRHQCLRITYCQPQPVVEAAVAILAEELRRAYRTGG